MPERQHSIIQVCMVVPIALLVLVRKFIIDAAHPELLTPIGMAAAVLALGTVYWLMRDQDRPDAEGGTSG